jgi:hypothetical protein
MKINRIFSVAAFQKPVYDVTEIESMSTVCFKFETLLQVFMQ